MTMPPKIVEIEDKTPLQQAVCDIADALQYPQDHKGYRYDVRYLIPTLAFHLARCGFRLDPEQALIKARRLPPTAGVVEDAVEWVSVDAADTIDDELAGATINDIARLSPAARAEFIRRLGGDGSPVNPPTDEELDERTPWHVQPFIRFDPEVEGE